MFENAKVGDKVWSINYGWGEITEIYTGDTYPICVRFVGESGITYTLNGYIDEFDMNPTLFWDELQFEIPVKPKRKIKKKIEGWCNIYDDGASHFVGTDLFKFDYEAKRYAATKYCVGQHLISFEYEVEED